MKTSEKTLFLHNLLCILIACASLVLIILTFTCFKNNYMSDEIWSYGLANSYYAPYIFYGDDLTTNFTTENYQNINVWTSSEIFYDYIVVNDGEEFSYDSVWYNQSQDIHPPLYYTLLHTICSFFPETFSPWFGFIINILCLLPTLYFLYKLCHKITHSVFLSTSLLAFYGFNCAAVDTFIFIRMYALVTLFHILLIYYVQKLISSNNKPHFLQHFLPLIFITVLGTLTQYHFALFAFFISLFTCIYYLFAKKSKLLFTFGFSMLLGILIAFLIFPSIITQISVTISKDLPIDFDFNLSYLLTLILKYQTGISVTPYKTMFFPMLFLSVIIFIFFSVPTWFVFRNEEWMKEFLFFLKSSCSLFVKNAKKLIITIPPIIYIMSCTLIAMILFFSKTLTVTLTAEFTSRYLFPIIPIYYLVFFSLLYYFAKSFSLSSIPCKKLLIIFTLICSLSSCLLYRPVFSFPNSIHSGKTMEQLEEDSLCIIALNEPWTLTCYPFFLSQTSDFCAVTLLTLFDTENDLSTLPASSNNAPIYLILDTTELISEKEISSNEQNVVKELGYFDSNPEHTYEDYLEYFSSLPYAERFELVGRDSAYCYDLEIYQLR